MHFSQGERRVCENFTAKYYVNTELEVDFVKIIVFKELKKSLNCSVISV